MGKHVLNQCAAGSFAPRFFFSSRRRHTTFDCDWSSYVCSSDLARIFFLVIGWRRGLDDAHDGGEIGGHLFEIGKRVGTVDARAVTCAFAGDDVAFVDTRKIGHRSEERRVGKEWRYRLMLIDAMK